MPWRSRCVLRGRVARLTSPVVDGGGLGRVARSAGVEVIPLVHTYSENKMDEYVHAYVLQLDLLIKI